ncbi:MAG: helix-hairpin-helix domain-containing protein [Candidatus Wallbacteria bacterium]|nr:helix-hairpin-helix domain-containing protein [Candidatus Wallbacteria bacterium]
MKFVFSVLLFTLSLSIALASEQQNFQPENSFILRKPPKPPLPPPPPPPPPLPHPPSPSNLPILPTPSDNDNDSQPSVQPAAHNENNEPAQPSEQPSQPEPGDSQVKPPAPGPDAQPSPVKPDSSSDPQGMSAPRTDSSENSINSEVDPKKNNPGSQPKPTRIMKANVNTASEDELAVVLPRSLAEKILAFRARNGGIGSLDELKIIFGEKNYQQLAGLLTIDDKDRSIRLRVSVLTRYELKILGIADSEAAKILDMIEISRKKDREYTKKDLDAEFPAASASLKDYLVP